MLTLTNKQHCDNNRFSTWGDFLPNQSKAEREANRTMRATENLLYITCLGGSLIVKAIDRLGRLAIDGVARIFGCQSSLSKDRHITKLSGVAGVTADVAFSLGQLALGGALIFPGVCIAALSCIAIFCYILGAASSSR